MEDWLASFSKALERGDVPAVMALFGAEPHWRDMVAFTWNIATFTGVDAIADMLVAALDRTAPTNWRLDGEITRQDDWQGAWLRFDTNAGQGRAHVRLRDGKAWTLLTTLTDLHNHPWAEGANRPAYGAPAGSREPEVVIIGGGQGGMALGARLKSLGVRAVILETQPRAGDSWRSRYESLALHDPVWYDHMPYIHFPAGWPVFTPKDMMGDWLEMYARVMGLDYWTSSKAVRATRKGDRWTVTVERAGETVTLSPRELVFATGMSGYPRVPAFDGAETFGGAAIHSSQYRTGANHKGARAVVIGSNTSAHDICQDLVEHGAHATMVQRSSTLVARSASVVGRLLGPLYSEEALARGMTPEQADFEVTTWPWALTTERAKPLAAAIAEADGALLDRLRAVGFLLDNGEDGAGIPLKSARRGGGFYIDVGASGMIADGRIALVPGQGIKRIERDAVIVSDGTRLPCDLLIYATGFGSMNAFVADICGQETADRVGRVWGLGAGLDTDPGPWEGELRNMWKPTAVDGLWFQGGNLAQSRHYSRFLALQLKARLSGLAVRVYGRPAVHHLS